MDSIVLTIILVSLILGIINKVDIFEEFINGVKEGLILIKSIFPTLLAFTLWTTALTNCGILVIIQPLFKPIITFLKIPMDIILMIFIRPFSSNGSLVVLNDIFSKFGVDHSYSILGSIIQTGSDTTFYVVTLYFSSVKMHNYRYALKLGLYLDMIAAMLALLAYELFII